AGVEAWEACCGDLHGAAVIAQIDVGPALLSSLEGTTSALDRRSRAAGSLLPEDSLAAGDVEQGAGDVLGPVPARRGPAG
ncbi:MAG: hypothetical protein L0G94_17440, partial [Brachybacterium sp.]|uniref:hypothetical protein n=1 Tax=Brachybacterium sp. TaxID=1891286 RepID=UPI002649F62A